MKYTLVLLVFLINGLANADDLNESSDQLCEKIKACAAKEVKVEREMSVEKKDMMEAIYGDLCESVISPYIVKTENVGLQAKAVACLDAINAMGCNDLLGGAGSETKACAEFQDAAQEQV